jgi:hypothetical protein
MEKRRADTPSRTLYRENSYVEVPTRRSRAATPAPHVTQTEPDVVKFYAGGKRTEYYYDHEGNAIATIYPKARYATDVAEPAEDANAGAGARAAPGLVVHNEYMSATDQHNLQRLLAQLQLATKDPYADSIELMGKTLDAQAKSTVIDCLKQQREGTARATTQVVNLVAHVIQKKMQLTQAQKEVLDMVCNDVRHVAAVYTAQ